MNRKFRTAILFGVGIGAFAVQLTCQAQSPNSTSNKDAAQQAGTTTQLLAAAGEEQPVNPTAAPAAAPAKNTTASEAGAVAPATAASTVAKVPLSNEVIVKELAEMKARIAQLEAELKESKEAGDAVTADKDANALRAAEAATTSAGTSSSTAGITQNAAAPATAAAPEISSQITTKGEPFEGDWTWLNSNGRVTDSPMSTKYFTPEFRADTNYMLSYNHPKDDSLGGSTATFRSDEF